MEYNRTMNETTFENKTQILADLWLNYRADGDFTDFVEYNDLGLPLAYAISAGIVPATDRAREFVEETFALLLAGMDITEDTGFESLDDLLQLDE
jgi:hypothetical protein